MFSLPWRKKEPSYEKVLANLTTKIKTHEHRLSRSRQSQRSLTAQVTLFGALITVIYTVIYGVRKEYVLEGQDVKGWSIKIAVFGIIPATIYLLRKVIALWYARRIAYEISQIENLKAKHAQKIEDLKQQTNYYSTQSILERYDASNSKLPSTPPPPNFSTQTRKGESIISPQLPNQNQGLRQRNPSNTRHSLPNLPPAPIPDSLSPRATRGTTPLDRSLIDNRDSSFHPSAFTPPPSPGHPYRKGILDKLLDLIVGEDENSPDARYALICKRCGRHNGLAPPGERGEGIGYECPKCHSWNGPEKEKSDSNVGGEDDKRNRSMIVEDVPATQDIQEGKDVPANTAEQHEEEGSPSKSKESK